MAIFYITLNEMKRDGTGRQAFPFKCDQPTVQALLAALARGLVQGSKIVYDGRSGQKIVTRESDRTINMGEVFGVEQSTARFVFTTPGYEKTPARAMRGGDFDGTDTLTMTGRDVDGVGRLNSASIILPYAGSFHD